MNFYEAKRMNAGITAIKSKTGEIMYLITGRKKSLLIDTCLGVKGLKELVLQYTSKPLSVLLTHGHVDHALGAAAFEDVYMSPLDQEIFAEHCQEEVRKGYLEMNMGPDFSELSPDDMLPLSFPEFKPLKDGDVFDLGDLHLDVFALPGHTPGSMIIRIREYRILILGDACNNSTFLFDEKALTVEAYKHNLIAVKHKLSGTFDCVFLCHHQMEACPDILENVIHVCDDILQERADDQPFEFMGTTNYIAKACNERFERLDGKEGNIVYSKAKTKK